MFKVHVTFRSFYSPERCRFSSKQNILQKKKYNMCIPPERKHRKTNRLLLLRNVLVIFLFVSVTTEYVFLMKHLSSFHVINHISTDKQCNILKYLFPATLYLFLSCPASSPPHFPSIFSTLIS